MSRNPCPDAVLKVLRENGVTDPAISNGGKHLQVRWQTPRGEPRMKAVATTPSDQCPHKGRAPTCGAFKTKPVSTFGSAIASAMAR
jgi:hypothetical protein